MTFNDELKRLRREYSQALPKRLTETSRLWQVLNAPSKNENSISSAPIHAATDSGDVFEDLFRQIHNLQGSAASFGFSRLGKHAQQLEAGIRPLLQERRAANAQELLFFRKGLQQLAKLITQGPEPMTKPSTPPALQPNAHKNQLSILVLTADSQLNEEIRDHLQLFGYQITIAEDRLTASTILINATPDAFIVDSPLTDELLEAYEYTLEQKYPMGTSLPVIFVSKTDNWDIRLKAVRMGAQAYLSIPIDYSQLVDQLDDLALRSEGYRILLVEDVNELAKHYALVLQNAGMLVKILTHPNQILHQVAEFQPELILMDLYMPDCSGFEAAQILRQHPDTLGIPIVFMSAESDRRSRIKALQQGDEFLLKPIMEDKLVRVCQVRARRARVLGELMYYDRLTGMLNHTTLKLKLENERLLSQRQSTTLCFVMLDLDHFKTVNDKYGHPAGDHILRNMAQLLKERLRRSDHTGRYGGEEFGLVLPDISLPKALELIDQLRLQFASMVHHVDQHKIQCTFSAGLACASDFNSTTELIKAADVALYQAKQTGRNRVCEASVKAR